jgi:hypothetical protein
MGREIFRFSLVVAIGCQIGGLMVCHTIGRIQFCQRLEGWRGICEARKRPVSETQEHRASQMLTRTVEILCWPSALISYDLVGEK